jgi:hypothetical protein
MATLRTRISRLEHTTPTQPDPAPHWLAHATDDELLQLEAICHAAQGRDYTTSEYQHFTTIKNRALKRMHASENPPLRPTRPGIDR